MIDDTMHVREYYVLLQLVLRVSQGIIIIIVIQIPI